MIKKILAASTVLLVAGSLAQAEIARALLTKENKFPETGQLEVGSLFRHTEFSESNKDIDQVRPYFRYGLVENVTFNADVPYLWVKPDVGQKEEGVGDVNLGLDLLAYKDIFDYPYVIPHVDVSLETGDQDKGLSNGDTIWDLGVSIGTVTYDVLHWIVDFAYDFNGGARDREGDNVFKLSGSLIWDVGDRFSVLAEGLVLDENSSNDRPFYFQGGMAYKATDNLQISAYGGGWSQSDEDVVASVKVGYQF